MKTPSEGILKLAEDVHRFATTLADITHKSTNQKKVQRALNAMADALDTHSHADIIMAAAMLTAYEAQNLAKQHDLSPDTATSIIASTIAMLAAHIDVKATELPPNPKDMH